jgi:hypothetical protein
LRSRSRKSAIASSTQRLRLLSGVPDAIPEIFLARVFLDSGRAELRVVNEGRRPGDDVAQLERRRATRPRDPR